MGPTAVPRPEKAGQAALLPGFAPAGTFETRDGRYLQIAAGGDNVWQRLAHVIGGEALLQDERYRVSRDRINAADELESLVADWVAQRDYDEAEGALIAAGVPAGGIFRAEDIAVDEHFLARESLIEVEDPRQGEIGMPGVIPKLSDTPGAVRWTGPQLGAHNREIYSDLLGLSAEDLRAMADQGIIQGSIVDADDGCLRGHRRPFENRHLPPRQLGVC